MRTDVHPGWAEPEPTRRVREKRPHTAPVVALPALPPPTDDPFASLTPTQRMVVELVGRGRSNGEAGAALGISEYTIKNHLTKVYRTLGLVFNGGETGRRLAYLVGYADGRKDRTS